MNTYNTNDRDIIVIPAYEPDRRLPILLKKLFLLGNAKIIVVDDGSGDNYTSIFNESKKYATILKHEKNRGKGAALKTAFSYIKENIPLAQTIVTADCDGQHSPVDIFKLFAEVKENPDKLILGSRKIKENTPLRSRLGNTITRLVFMLTSSKYVYDTQTGLRAFSGKYLDYMIMIDGDRYEYEMNVLMKWAKDKKNFKEVPIETIYIMNNSSSHFNTLKDSYRIYKEIGKYSASSFISFLIDYIAFIILSNIINTSFAASIVLCNVVARIISASANYTLNKKYVFKSKEKNSNSLIKYILLAITIIVLNTCLLSILTKTIIKSRYIAKITVEIVMFIFNFFIQKLFVFKNKEINSHERGGYMSKRKKEVITVAAYSLVLCLFTSFVMLKTFVIKKAEITNVKGAGIYAEEESVKIADDSTSSSDDESSSHKSPKDNLGTKSSPKNKPDSDSSSHRGPGHGKHSDSSDSSESDSNDNHSRKHSSSSSDSSDSSSSSSSDSNSSNNSSSDASNSFTSTNSDLSYSDDNITINIEETRINNTNVYIADITVSSMKYLKAAFAENTYGRNIKDTTSDIASEHDAILAINGDFYGFRDYGYVIRNGVLYRETAGDGECFVMYEDGSCDIVKESDVSAADLYDDGVVQCFSFGPGLISDGEITVDEDTEVNQAMGSNPRTAIGMIDPLHYVFIVSDGRTSDNEGLTLYELAQICKDYGCSEAYNLDGGGSTTMYFNGEVINNPSSTGKSSEREVSDIVYIG